MYPVDLFLVLVLVAHTTLQDPPLRQPCPVILSYITVQRKRNASKLDKLKHKIFNTHLFYVVTGGHTINYFSIIKYWGR